MPKKIRVARTVHLRAYDIVADQVENWISHGWDRAHKHTDEPGEETIKREMYEAVMSGLCELFDFGD